MNRVFLPRRKLAETKLNEQREPDCDGTGSGCKVLTESLVFSCLQLTHLSSSPFLLPSFSPPAGHAVQVGMSWRWDVREPRTEKKLFMGRNCTEKWAKPILNFQSLKPTGQTTATAHSKLCKFPSGTLRWGKNSRKLVAPGRSMG
jgi:hypothetical protein